MARNYGQRNCEICGSIYTARQNYQRFCSEKCRSDFHGHQATDIQYTQISGNWNKYLRRLLYKKNRENLSIDDLLYLLNKQKYQCALTGMDLTCTLKVGQRFLTNASIDRINPGGPYSLDNIRLVCWIVNVMKWNMSDAELKGWCQKILRHESQL